MDVEIACGKCDHRMTIRGESGEKINFCPACGAAIEIPVGGRSPVRLESQERADVSAAPRVIPRADVEPRESKPQVAPSPEPVVGQPKAGSSAFWAIAPAVVAAMATFGFLMCGGIVLLLSISGGSDDAVTPEPYTAYSVPAYSYSSDPYASSPYDSAGDYSSTYAETPYVPASYAADPYASTPAEVAPTYFEPAYAEPTYVEPAYAEPLASPASENQFWSFADPQADLLAAIQRDEQELVGMDAAILAARVGEAAGGVEAQDGETVADQLFGILFAVGSDAVEQQLLAERAVVQARLDANRAELVRLRGY